MPGHGSSCPGIIGKGSQGHSQGSEGGSTAHDGHLEGAPADSPGPQALTASHLGLWSGQPVGPSPWEEAPLLTTAFSLRHHGPHPAPCRSQ